MRKEGLALTVVILIITGIVGGVIGFQYSKIKNNSSPSQPKASETFSLNATYNTYTNFSLGFSVQIPKHMTHFYGSCQWNAGENSFRPKEAPVPVKTFEQANHVFISSEFYYSLGGERRDSTGVSYFSSCDKVENSLDLLSDQKNYNEQMWEITVDAVSNDTQLAKFIKDYYGSSCRIGEKQPSGQNGVYDVKIQGDGKELDETLCPLNYLYVLKYYPAQKKVASWPVGQACVFTDFANHECLDVDMIKSFRFL